MGLCPAGVYHHGTSRREGESTLLGKHHPLIRRIRALRRDASLRRSDGVFLAEGPHLVADGLVAGAEIEVVVVSPRLSRSVEGRALLAAIREHGARCEETSDELLDRIQDARHAQPVTCVVRRGAATALETLARETAWALVLDSIQDPGNLGSIVRSADAAGCGLCVVTGRSADPFHPRAVRATAGSIFRLPVVEESGATGLDGLVAGGLELVGADPREGAPYDEADLTARVALVMGGEAEGPSDEVRRRLTRTVRIPMRAAVESLSVSAAAAVLLFEIARQRRR